MLYKISIALLFPLLIISFFLAINGVQQITFGDTYYVFLSNVSSTYESWSFSIPTIPKVPEFQGRSISDAKNIFDYLKLFANFFVNLLNASITVLNVGITVINVLIHIIQFCFSLIYCCKDFIFRVSQVGVLNLRFANC